MKNWLGKINLEYLWALLLAVLFSLPYLMPASIPCFDSAYMLYGFDSFYNHLSQYHSWLMWFPHELWGQPASYLQIGCLTPMTYVVCLAGVLLGIKNTYLLFKISMLAEVFVYATGLHLLFRKIIPSRYLRYALYAGGLFTVDWIHSADFNLRSVCLLPFVIWSLHVFWTEKKAVYAWLSFFFMILGVIGNAPYAIAPVLLFSCVFSLPFFMESPRDIFRIFERNRKTIFWASVCVIISAVFLATAFDFLSQMVGARPGRAQGSNMASLDQFIQSASPKGSWESLTSFLFGMPDVILTSYYVGLLPLFFIVWGICRKITQPVFRGSLYAIAAAFCATRMGLLTIVVYYFPFFAFARYLQYIFGGVRVFLLLAAGIGCMDFFNWLKTRQGDSWPVVPRRFFVGVVIAGIFLADAFMYTTFRYSVLVTPYNDELAAIFLFYARLFGYVGVGYLCFAPDSRRPLFRLFNFKSRRSIATIAVLWAIVFAVDCISYSAAYYRYQPKIPAEKLSVLSAFDVRATPLPQRECRLSRTKEKSSVKDQRAENARALMALDDTVYAEQAGYFLNRDMVPPERSYLFIARGVYQLLQLNRGDASAPPDAEKFFPKNNPALRNVLGVDGNMFRLCTQWKYSSPQQQPLVAFTENSDKIVYLNGSGEGSPKATRPTSDIPLENSIPVNPAPDPGEVRMLSGIPGHIELEVDVKVNDGAWLVYSDTWHPGWSATVDGKKTEVYKAYETFKCIWVPAGKHRIVMDFFSPWPFAMACIGLVVGLVAVGLMLKLCFIKEQEK